jgi:hypothetical protein
MQAAKLSGEVVTAMATFPSAHSVFWRKAKLKVPS